MGRFSDLLKAWLLPTRHTQNFSGWLQVISALGTLLVPAGILATIRHFLHLSTRFGSRDILAVVLATGLVLALWALWRELPNPSISFYWDISETGFEYAIPGGMSKYFSVRVDAKSPVMCEGLLLRVEIAVNGNYQDVTHFNNAQRLNWHNMNAEPVLVEPDVPRRLNLVCTETIVPGSIILTVESHDARGVPTALSAGKYRLTVRVTGPKTKAIYARFEVEGGATWNEISVKRVSDPPRASSSRRVRSSKPRAGIPA